MSYIPRVNLECIKYAVKVRQSSKCSSCAAAMGPPTLPAANNLSIRRFSTILQLQPKLEDKVKVRKARKKELFNVYLSDRPLPKVDSVVKKMTTPAAPSTFADTVVEVKKKERFKSLKPAQQDKVAKVKKNELERSGKEVSFNSNLLGYLQTCLYLGDKHRALKSLQYYRQKASSKNGLPVTDMSIYNALLHSFAEEGNLLKVKEVLGLLAEDGIKPTVQSFAAVIECLGRNPTGQNFRRNMNKTIQSLHASGSTLDDIFNNCVFEKDQREVTLAAIQSYDPKYVPRIREPKLDYVCNLLEKLNQNELRSSYVSPAQGLISIEELEIRAKRQLENEVRGTVTIKSIEKKSCEESSERFRTLLSQCEEGWKRVVKAAFIRNMNVLKRRVELSRYPWGMSLYPYLSVLQPDEIADIIIAEIRNLAAGSETYSPSINYLYRDMGLTVQGRFQTLQKKDAKILDKVEEMYGHYIRWYMNPEDCTAQNTRQKWQQLTYERSKAGPDVDVREKHWSAPVLNEVGRFLYSIIMQDVKIDVNILRRDYQRTNRHLVPAFYSIFRTKAYLLKEEVKPHPILVRLFVAASRDELSFQASQLPMLCPPLPWVSIRTGGYLLSAAKLVRLPYMAYQQSFRMEKCVGQQLYPALDCLNQLSSIPWKINEEVLDVLLEVFNSNGNPSIGVPAPPSECPTPPAIDASMTKAETNAAHKQRLLLRRRRAEMYSMWCDALYRLSLAHHFRKDIFWLPHNMDFRGRVYPCPPHLTHLGADPARAILIFAKGEPLGKTGLDWLKIHCINLTGLKKRDSVKVRLAYANEILDLILDSAEKPLTGQKWWMESDEPWQTLSCCMEIRNVLNSGDTEGFVSHYPVHQDGSCNGLQHYAALGRDQAGAESVNLAPSEVPQDVYSSVAALVEKLRQRDAADGVVVAQKLEGFIKRKVIKQTVMTTVYGVTRYGARLQIAKQLKDIPEFPKECIWQASTYLTAKTFASLQEMFTSAKQIQDWFTDCARQISVVCGENVEWVTPLGLPVVQPYSRVIKSTLSHNPAKVVESFPVDMYERPDVMKQKNAFPPNYIHSLDSTHMMLTSLNCERAGMTFVSVHDCFWTHPKNVEVMNRICREQFVALHSERILEDLSKFLVRRYSYDESEMMKKGLFEQETQTRLNQVLQAVPPQGSFDLRNVIKSIYFFS